MSYPNLGKITHRTRKLSKISIEITDKINPNEYLTRNFTTICCKLL